MTRKNYELSNHLGNVYAVVKDKKIGVATTQYLTSVSYYKADVIMSCDYYAFGAAMPQRVFNSPDYRYGFNGKETDAETDLQDYGFRIYNPALGKFLSIDPLTKDYPWYTPYQFAGNKPIWAIDLDGLEECVQTIMVWTDSDGDQQSSSVWDNNPVRSIRDLMRYGKTGLLVIWVDGSTRKLKEHIGVP